MFNENRTKREPQTLDLYEVTSVDNGKGTVTIKKCVTNIDKTGEEIKNLELKNVPVYCIFTGTTTINFEIKVGDKGIYFITKSPFFNKVNTTGYYNLKSGFFLPIYKPNIIPTGIDIKTNEIKIESSGEVTIKSTKITLTSDIEISSGKKLTLPSDSQYEFCMKNQTDSLGKPIVTGPSNS